MQTESALLEVRQKQIQQKYKELRLLIKQGREREKIKWLSQRDGSHLAGPVSQGQVDSFAAKIDALPQRTPAKFKPKLSLMLPKSIQALLSATHPNQAGQLPMLTAPADAQYLQVLRSSLQFDQSIPRADISRFLRGIPLPVRAQFVRRLENLVPEGLRDQYIKDTFMAAYAHCGRPDKVESILSTCAQPTVYSYAHLAKSRFKAGMPPETVFAVLSKMEKRGLEPSVQVYTTAVQSLVQHDRFDDAFGVFSKMKYISEKMQPDTRLYNTMILAAAKFNVNKALDLFQEMRTRQPKPVLPDSGTYNAMVYACARDPTTHLSAWSLFAEALNQGYKLNNESFRSLMYLCGSTGELLLARGLIRRLSATNADSVDNFMLNCLFLAYYKWDPASHSQSQSSKLGRDIRNLLLSDSVHESAANTNELPFLPTSNLTKELVAAESRALFEYLADASPEFLTISNAACGPKYRRSSIFNTVLKTAIKLSPSIESFRELYETYTYAESSSAVAETDLEGADPKFRLAREHHLYMIAMDAAAQFKDLEFGQRVWTERGEWRKHQNFAQLELEQRKLLDFKFARSLVHLLAEVGNSEEAVLLLKSAAGLHDWRAHDIPSLLGLCHRLEDRESLDKINSIIYKSRPE